MRIERIQITGFGCLTDRTYHFPAERAVLILEDNESGKSTLAAAILAGICGMPPRKQSGEKIKLLDVFRPWNGEAYGVVLDLNAGGRRCRVERDFARGTFSVRDIETGADLTATCNTDLASHFLRLPREDFSRVAFLSGKELHEFASTNNIRERLSAAVEGSRDQAGSEAAISALRNPTYNLNGRNLKTETAVSRLEQEIARKEETLAQLDGSMEEAGGEVEQMEALQTTHSELTRLLSDLDSEYRAVRLREVRERIDTAQSITSEAERLKAEMHELEEYATFPAERKEQLTAAVTRESGHKVHVATLTDEVEALQQQVDELKIRVASEERFTGAGEPDVRELLECEVAIRNAAESQSRKREEIESEMRRLADRGIDLESSRKLHECFKGLSTDDREYLRRCREIELEMDASVRDAEDGAANCGTQLSEIERTRSAMARKGKGLLAAGAVLGLTTALTAAFTVGIWASIVALVIACAAAFSGITRVVTAGSVQSDKKARLERAEDEYKNSLKSALWERESHEARVSAIAKSTGYESSALLLRAFRECEQAVSVSGPIAGLNAQLDDIVNSLAAAAEKAQGLLRRYGVSTEHDDPGSALKRTRETLSAWLHDRASLSRVEQEISRLGRQIQTVKESAAAEHRLAWAILEDAGIGNAVPLDEGIAEFNRRERLYRRYRQIKDTELPSASRHAVPDASLAALIAEESELLAQASSPADSGRTPDDVENERMETRAVLDATAAQIREIERRVGACVDAYRARYPVESKELAGLRRELARASRFQEATATAALVLQEVTDSSRRRWATALNTRAAGILPHLNNDYDTLRFDETLSFTLRRTDSGKVIDKDSVDACLSTGAKDQIYLAVRLACCSELSEPEESLPIILDDPMMAADDSRFSRGMEHVMSSLSLEHQVIVLSCHKSRHNGLLHAPWFTRSAQVLEI